MRKLAKWPAIGLAIFVFVVFVPKFFVLLNSSTEGATQGKLYHLRAALHRYHEETGAYPADLADLTRNAKYLESIPSAATPPFHRDSSRVLVGTDPDDQGGWLYDGDGKGGLWVNCTHNTTKKKRWDQY